MANLFRKLDEEVSRHPLSKVMLYLRTVHHLRLIQVFARIWYRIAPVKVDSRAAPPVGPRPSSWITWKWRLPALGTDGTATFIGVTRRAETATDWDDDESPKLWRYNLHYHDDLVAEGNEGRSEFLTRHVDRWIAENPPPIGTGWEPYPMSLRIVNWIKWSWNTAQAFDEAAQQSLAIQVRLLRTRVEWHLLGNHVWANAKALTFAGRFFGGPEADTWYRYGLSLFLRQLEEQILTDGGHYERSPMYQAIMIEDLLDILQIVGSTHKDFDAGLCTRLSETASRMLRWLRVMTHPDGKLAFFNDAAFGIGPEVARLEEYARLLGVDVDDRPFAPIESLYASGYYRLSVGRAVVICDIAALGPDYQPGHAHADTLSFECSLDQTRVVVNGGTSTYEVGVQRTYERGTAAHSTVVISTADSSEVWGGFRVARRAHATHIASGIDGTRVWLEGTHDGYERLPDGLTHTRRWELRPDALTVTDQLSQPTAAARAIFHLGSDIVATFAHERVMLALPNGAAMSIHSDGGTPSVHASRWSPVFGATVPSQRIETPMAGDSLLTRFDW
jgi:uncharacterized heparinase superfamily protein